jgi:hypothetical protein
VGKPEHVEQLEGGGMVCRHCGGSVDAEGYSDGGEVESEIEAAQEGDTDTAPEQGVATERMRDAAFADAVRRRAR